MARFSQSLIGLLTAATMTASLGAAAQAAPKKDFDIAWTIYVGWMPWPYAAEAGIVKKWGDKYGINIKITQINDYVESINQYTAGKFDGVTVTNMDSLTVPAAGGVDTSAIVLGDFSNGNDGIEISRGTGRLVGSNIIQLNGRHGIAMSDTASIFQGQGQFDVPNVADTVQNNTQAGINAFNGSSLDITNILIQNNGQRGISLSLNVSASLQNATIRNNTNDGISLFNASTLQHSGAPSNVVITGNTGFGIQCFGAEASFVGDVAGVTGNALGTVSCTGF